jgi:hypothetical protein
MSIKKIVRQCVGVVVSLTITMGGSISAASAQTASEVSIYQAGYSAAQRLVQEGFRLYTLDGAPYDVFFARNGEVTTMDLYIPRTGNYVLLVGGDNDTYNLDVYFPQADASDITYGRTGFINFDVYRPGRFVYQIDMLSCKTANCGVYAVLLRVSD